MKNIAPFQQASCVFRIDFALSKWPHFHKVYLVAVRKRGAIAVCKMIDITLWNDNFLYMDPAILRSHRDSLKFTPYSLETPQPNILFHAELIKLEGSMEWERSLGFRNVLTALMLLKYCTFCCLFTFFKSACFLVLFSSPSLI